MKTTLSIVAVLALGSAIGCGSGGSEGEVTRGDPTALTVSLRNKVRLPGQGHALTAEDYATQTRTRDPVSEIRCLADETPAFKETALFLGGIAWSHPMARVLDSDQPRLYDGKYTEPSANEYSSSGGSMGADSAGPAPVIERPDLVGIQNGTAIFLSKQHGLLAVDAKTGTPDLSCSMKLPGEPKNFLFRGNELVVIVNALNGANRSALIRYAIEGSKLRFVDSVKLEGQTITDARTFDSTIVLYTSWTKARPSTELQQPLPLEKSLDIAHPSRTAEYGPSFGSGSGGVRGPGQSDTSNQLGTKLLVVQWDDALQVDWEDSLLNDPRLEDLDNSGEQPNYTPDQIVYGQKSYKPFVAASDRYIAVPRDVTTTRFDRYETTYYTVCTSYNPKAYEERVCSVKYEQRANPDYRAPSPTTGDYSCNGKKLADCVKEAAPSVSQFIYVPVGQDCRQVWYGRCEASEQRSSTHPIFKTTRETEMTIYRFEDGSFTKLDATFGKLVPKGDAIAFEKKPLSLEGTIQNRNQIQFQNGHLYFMTEGSLQTLSVAGGSISWLNRLDVSTGANPAIVFSDTRAMVSAAGGGGSTVSMLDLTEPSEPKSLTAFGMPGQSTQLILAKEGILGPGTVDLSHERVGRRLQKLTLFSKDAGTELDNLLLGTEFDAFETSWLASDDDQRIRLAGARLFLPYSGRHHAIGTEPVAHRLNISRIDNGRLVSERSFQVSDEIIRTTSIDDNRALVFANSAAYLVDRTTGDWALRTLRELFVPFATYRVSDDGDLYARLDRVGSRCRITTHKGDPNVFETKALAETIVTCDDGAPIGKGKNVLFNQTRTGVRISPDGLSIQTLSAEEADALLKKEAPKTVCYIPNSTPNPANENTRIWLLDTIPSEILCVQPAKK